MIENKCPKCGKKLSLFYLKQECPDCHVNLLYYNLDARLEADRQKAEREQKAVENFLCKLKLSTFGGILQTVRFILFFTPLLYMLLPVFSWRQADDLIYQFTLQGVIIGFVRGQITFDLITGNQMYLFPILTMASVIVFSLAVIISSLFSCTKNALLRNICFSTVNILALTIGTVLCIMKGLDISIGLYITFAEYIITFIMHILCDRKIKLKTEGK